MRITIVNLLVLSILLRCALCSENTVKERPRPCPETNCADPRLDTKTGCYSCESSRCKFRGCVKFGAHGPSWMPDNCTVCYCDQSGGGEFCTKLECPKLDCFGFPTVQKPNHCCPQCDFGDKVSENDCAAIPVKRKSMYVALGDDTCQRDVITYGCDKEYVVNEEGEWFGCEPVKVNVTVSFPNCRHRHTIGHVMYEEVIRCTKRRLELNETPMDFDPTPSWECPLYIDPQSTSKHT